MSEIVQVEPEIIKDSSIIQAQTAAEVDQQITTAKRYPRVLSKVRDKVFELATIDKETAEKCWYALPRDGKVIQGPSVRLAEIVASSYGNLRVGTRIVGIDDKHVTCQAVCYDLENNVAVQTEVKRRITNRTGQRYSEDMIVTTSNAGSSIALRNAVFKTIPMVLFKSILDKVRKVGMGDERSFIQERDATIAKLVKMGADTKKIAGLLGKRGAPDLDTDDVVTLKGIITAIEDKETTIEEAFAEPIGKKEVGQVDMSKVKAGDPAKHQGHDVKAPLKPAQKADGGDGEAAEMYRVELGMCKDDLKELLRNMSPEASNKILEDNGIASLDSCTDLPRMKKALADAQFWAEKPRK